MPYTDDEEEKERLDEDASDKDADAAIDSMMENDNDRDLLSITHGDVRTRKRSRGRRTDACETAKTGLVTRDCNFRVAIDIFPGDSWSIISTDNGGIV